MIENQKTTLQKFLVTGSSSGLGYHVALQLLNEGHQLLLVARREKELQQLQQRYPDQVTFYCGDLTNESFVNTLAQRIPHDLSGAFINAGGPPAKKFTETTLNDWDEAYRLLVRWKVQLISSLISVFEKNGYGRVLLSESTSINRPVKNLILSNSLRMATIGLVKTLVHEHRSSGITFNIIAPGYHQTAALGRLYQKISVQENIPPMQAKERIVEEIPVGHTGDVGYYASLASWLLSPKAAFVTGQIFSIDGGTSV